MEFHANMWRQKDVRVLANHVRGRIAEFYVQGRSQKVDTAVHRDSVAIQHSMIVFGPKGETRIKRCGSRAGRGKTSSWRDRAPDHQPNLVLFGFVLGSRAGSGKGD
jgi:hypothetical protein